MSKKISINDIYNYLYALRAEQAHLEGKPIAPFDQPSSTDYRLAADQVEIVIAGTKRHVLHRQVQQAEME